MVKASDVLGGDIKNLQDETLGEVKELALDVESGRLLYVIAIIGATAGIGGQTVALPPHLLTYDNQRTLRVDAAKEKLKGAPAFDLSKWDEYGVTNRIPEFYGYFGREDAANPPRATGIPAETTARSEVKGGGLERASKIVGSTVENLQNQNLGKVQDLIVDLNAGRISQVILSSGGFLGIGDTLSAVPPSAFRYDVQKEALRLDTNKEALAKAPHFKADQWPDFSDPAYASGVYRAHRVEPYFNTNRAADNTARNVRDRQEDALTPLDQGSSEADRETTRQIRREILAQKDVSINARNVKIITANGKVTLRGPVNTENERHMIAQIAERVAKRGNVDNQLEVKREQTNEP
jgi:sporulation protein YlmC with PRC-barrel domain